MTPKMPSFKWGEGGGMPGASLTSIGCVFAPESADRGSFLSCFPFGPRPWGKGRKCMFGNWYHWNSYLNVHDHQHPSFPQGEVEGAVGVGPLCGSAPEESDYHGIAGPEGRHFF